MGTQISQTLSVRSAGNPGLPGTPPKHGETPRWLIPLDWLVLRYVLRTLHGGAWSSPGLSSLRDTARKVRLQVSSVRRGWTRAPQGCVERPWSVLPRQWASLVRRFVSPLNTLLVGGPVTGGDADKSFLHRVGANRIGRLGWPPEGCALSYVLSFRPDARRRGGSS